MSNASGNINTPDSDFFYDSLRLEEIRKTYSHDDVLAYIKTRFTYDLLWLFIYGTYMVSTIAYMTKSWKKVSILMFLYSLPLVAVSLDLLENILCSLYFLEIYQGLTGFCTYCQSIEMAYNSTPIIHTSYSYDYFSFKVRKKASL